MRTHNGSSPPQSHTQHDRDIIDEPNRKTTAIITCEQSHCQMDRCDTNKAIGEECSESDDDDDKCKDDIKK